MTSPRSSVSVVPVPDPTHTLQAPRSCSPLYLPLVTRRSPRLHPLPACPLLPQNPCNHSGVRGPVCSPDGFKCKTLGAGTWLSCHRHPPQCCPGYLSKESSGDILCNCRAAPVSGTGYFLGLGVLVSPVTTTLREGVSGKWEHHSTRQGCPCPACVCTAAWWSLDLPAGPAPF